LIKVMFPGIIGISCPDIVESIIAGQQPADLNVEKLTKRTDLPLDWNQQRQL